MIDNPAQRLYDRLTEWKTLPPTVKPAEARSDERGWLTPHIEALALLELVCQHLEGKSGYDTTLDSIARCIFGGSIGLFGASGGETRMIDDHHLTTLKAIADFWPQPTIVIPELVGLGLTISEIRELVTDSDYLDEEARRYLFELLEALDRAIQEFQTFGTGQVRSLVAKLIGSLTIYFFDAPDSERERASGVFYKLVDGVKKTFRVFAPHLAKEITEHGFDLARSLPPGI